MNIITVAGRLTKDAELRHTQSGETVCSFSVADDQGRDKKAIFWNASLWGKRAEALQPYLTKGASVTVVGTVSEREFTDKEGQQRKSQDVRVQDIALQGGRQQGEAPAPQRQAAAPRPAPAATSGFEDMEDDIPF
jgi:single-strand DNA-binding protein